MRYSRPYSLQFPIIRGRLDRIGSNRVLLGHGTVNSGSVADLRTCMYVNLGGWQECMYCETRLYAPGWSGALNVSSGLHKAQESRNRETQQKKYQST